MKPESREQLFKQSVGECEERNMNEHISLLGQQLMKFESSDCSLLIILISEKKDQRVSRSNEADVRFIPQK